MSANAVAEETVRNILLGVRDPELGDHIVDLGMVQVIEIDPSSGEVDVTIEQPGVPLLGSIPLDPAVAAGGDACEPAVTTLRQPKHSRPWPNASSPKPSHSWRSSPAPPAVRSRRSPSPPRQTTRSQRLRRSDTLKQRQGALSR